MAQKSRLSVFLGIILVLAVIAALVFAIVLISQNRQGSQPTDPDANPSLVDSQGSSNFPSQAVSVDMDGEGGEDEEPGFSITLSDGQAQDQQTEPVTLVTGEALTQEEIAAILARLPELEVNEEDQVEFKLPGDPIPPPRPGSTIDQVFPYDGEDLPPEGVESGPLEVLRYSPEGDVPIAPTINVTFNQPMVPLATLAQLAEEDVPVRIEPEVPGTWSWIGTRTLSFHFDSELIDRLPMATEYTVTIPAGTQSVSGSELAQTVTWQFRTPAPTLTAYYPADGPQDLEPFIYVEFDQRVDPQEMLGSINATADGKPFEIALSDEDAYQEDDAITRRVENAAEGRWLVFQAVEPLPKDSDIQITIDAGAPSAEGPIRTNQPQTFSFYTYATLKVEEHGCSWYGDDCYPLAPFYIRFNNPIDLELYDDSMITIDPVIPGATVSIYGNTINIQGATEGRTNYYVTVDESLTDTFGQQLGRDEKLTFKVGKAEPVLVGPEETFITLDPSSVTPQLSMYSINYDRLDVQIYAVEPADWPDFQTFMQNYYRTDQPSTPPGQLVMDETLKLDTPNDVLTEVGVDLSPVMDGDSGHFVVIVKPPKGFFEDEHYWETVLVWVQVTEIGLDVFSDQNDIYAWTTSLDTGAPLEGVDILDDSGELMGSTGPDGLAQFVLPQDGTQYVLARQGEDTAMLLRSPYAYDERGWESFSPPNTLSWYVFDDRSMYRPGEDVHFKGWVRLITTGEIGDVELLGESLQAVNYQVIGPQGNEIATGTAEVDQWGGFDFSLTLPEQVNLGYASVYFNAVGSLSGNINNVDYYHDFQIQEFRRPEFEVTARNETTGPYFVGDDAVVAVEAAYYAGGPLPNAEVNWMVSSSPTNYQPPNWPDFSFGTWTPWWYYGGYYWEDDVYYGDGGSYDYLSGYTDATGNHYLDMTFDNTGEPRPQSVVAEASVMDVNRQAWAGSTSLLVHPADLYVGMHTERYFVERNTPIDVELIVTDLDGNAVADKDITVTASRLQWKYQQGSWQEVEVERQECLAVSQSEPVTCTFETPIGGKYSITATITDDLDRQNQSNITRWVSGGQLPTTRKVEQQEATLIPDKETYQPGDTAEILVQSPFSPAEGLMTVTRNGVLYTERFVIEEDTTTLLVPIEDAHIPNLNIQVDLVGATARTDERGDVVEDAPDRPAYASGSLTLQIPPISRTLSVELDPRETELAPGDSTTLDIVLKDAEGAPVSDASLAVVIVDESILALTNYQLADPLSVFYYTRPSNLTSVYGRSSIILVDPQALAAATRTTETQALAGGVMDDAVEEEAMAEAPTMESSDMDMAIDEGSNSANGDASSSPIAIRTDFNPLAVFAPAVRTDEDGTASVRVSLPDNLTRYRIMVVAVDESGKRFGSAESSLTARLPLMVRPSASRFLNFGDQFEMPVVLQNQTDDDMTVEVIADAANLNFTEGTGLRVTIPANDRIEVRFPGTTDSAGTAHVRFAAVSGADADAAVVSLPVYTPATTEAFATYGVIDEGAVLQPLETPEGVIPVYGGLEVTTSSTALQSLTDAVLYLVSYPFDCSEQIASRILSIASLRDVLTAFEAEGLPSPAEMEASVVSDIEELARLQNYDGGFPYWRRGNDSIPFNTVHVAYALQRARMMGFDVPDDMWQNVLYYLQNIEDYYPSWYSQRVRQTISAYALFVRMQMDDPDTAKAYALYNDAPIEDFSLEAVAWMWQVLGSDPQYADAVDTIRRHVNNQAVETAGAANFTTGYDDSAYVLLHSNRRTDALLLDALIADNPQSDLIPKVVTGLLAHRTAGRWYNTQENVFVLLALDRYFNTFESVEPDFVARLWIGETYAGSSTFEGYSTDSYQLDVPMSYLVDTEEEQQDIILQKDGDGRLYYRLGLRYAPTDLKLDPVDMGFVVQRQYEAVDDPEDVYQDADGVWHIKAGARVRVRVTMVADNRRYHVALVDPLPAGLEIINPALAVSETVPADPNNDQPNFWWWRGTWYEHQNLRDERAEAFTSLLWDGVYEYTYVTRATMPGTFVAPPAKAEEMYAPEVFGRSASDIVIVE